MARVEIAGQGWGWVADTKGNAQAGATVQIHNLDGTNATHWSAITGGSSETSTLTTNADGTIPRYIEAGSYNVTVGATTRRVEAAEGSAAFLNVRSYGATGQDNATADYAGIAAAIVAAEALIDGGAPGAKLWFPKGTYRGDTVTSAGGLDWIWAVGRSGIHLDFEPGAVLKTTQNAALIFAAGANKPAGALSWANYWLGDATKATYRAISAVSRGARAITLSTPAQASEFPIGAWVYIRTGQCNATTVTEPVAEINQIIGSDTGTGVLTLRWPVAKDYAQEYFISGTTGKTSTSVTANLAVFGVANVSDRIIENFRISNLTLDAQNCTVSAIRADLGIVGNTIEGLRGVVAGNPVDNIETRGCRFRDWRVRSNPAASGSYRWAWAFGTGCVDGIVEDVEAVGEGQRMLTFHIHEGSADITVRRSKLVTPVGNDDITPVSIRARGWNINLDDVEVVSAGTQSPVFVSPEVIDPYGLSSVRNVRARCSDATRGINVQGSGWKIRDRDPNTPLRQAQPGGGFSVPTTASGGTAPGVGMEIITYQAWLDENRQTVVLGPIPDNTMLWDASIWVHETFDSDGTDRVTVGWDGNTQAFIVSTAMSDLSVLRDRPVLFNEDYYRVYQGPLLTQPRILKAYYVNGGSEPTQGKVLVTVTLHHNPEVMS